MAPLTRHCFVTVGSIASFRDLLTEILQPKFLDALWLHDFGVLEVQCGPDYDWFKAQVDSLPEAGPDMRPTIRCFAYTNKMKDHMLMCRGVSGGQAAGCIISHAGMCSLSLLAALCSCPAHLISFLGAGTVMEAIRYGVPLIVVPNSTLLDNHQAELAEECEKQNWAIYGKIG